MDASIATNCEKNLWERAGAYRHVLVRRATGELPPMEATLHFAEIVEKNYRAHETLLDAGAGPAHFLREFRRFMREEEYRGIDISSELIAAGQEIFPKATLRTDSIEALDPKADAADHVVCCNVLPHVSNVRIAIDKLLAVTRKHLYVRFLVDETTTYMIRHVHNDLNYAGISTVAPADELDAQGSPRDFHHFNVYSRGYIEGLLKQSSRVKSWTLYGDTFFDPARIAADARGPNSTRIVEGQMAIGRILCPWAYLVVNV